MTRGTLATRLAALPLTVIAATATGMHAHDSHTATGSDCAAFAAVYSTQVAPIFGKVIPGERAVNILGDLAATLAGTDPASTEVRSDAQRVISDLERYDGPAAERDAVTLESDTGHLLAQCGSAEQQRTA